MSLKNGRAAAKGRIKLTGYYAKQCQRTGDLNGGHLTRSFDRHSRVR